MEILVKAGDGPSPTSYKDGDIVQAFSMDQIYFCHAQHVCHITNFDLDSTSGLRVADPLLIKFLEKTHIYKFQRVNSNEVVRTNLQTGEQKTLSPTIDQDGESIHAYDYLSNKLKSSRHKVFGSSGLEYWYGGAKKFHDLDINDIWNDIETHTYYLQSNHINWPLADIEKKRFLPINCCEHTCEDHHDDHEHHDDHDDAACLACTCSCDLSECTDDFISERISCIDIVHNEGSEEEYNEILHRRKYNVPYWDMSESLSINVDQVRDIEREMDIRLPLSLRPAAKVLTVNKIDSGQVIL